MVGLEMSMIREGWDAVSKDLALQGIRERDNKAAAESTHSVSSITWEQGNLVQTPFENYTEDLTSGRGHSVGYLRGNATTDVILEKDQVTDAEDVMESGMRH